MLGLVRMSPEVSYPGPGQSAVRAKSNAFHTKNTATSCLLSEAFDTAIARRDVTGLVLF